MAAFSTIAAVVAAAATTAGAVNSIQQSRRAGQVANNAADRADPFAGMRPEFQDMLRTMFPDLINLDPRAIENDPQYQFQRDEALGTVDGSSGSIAGMASSQGLLRSGNHEQERMRFASGLAGQFANDRFTRQMGILGVLARLSGADAGNPAAAGNILQGGQINSASQFNSGVNAFGGSLANWSSIINNWNSASGGFGGGSPGGGP